jgi:hypothetical protein
MFDHVAQLKDLWGAPFCFGTNSLMAGLFETGGHGKSKIKYTILIVKMERLPDPPECNKKDGFSSLRVCSLALRELRELRLGSF